MFDEMFPDAQQTIINDIARRGLPPRPAQQPGAFAGFGRGAGGGLMEGFASTARGFGMAAGVAPMAMDRGVSGFMLDVALGQDREPLSHKYFRTLDDYTKSAVNYWKPDPATMGTASQVVNGFARIVGPLMLGAGNPSFVVTSEQVSAFDTLADQGVDFETANKAATVRGVTTAVGMALPAAMVAGRGRAALAGAAVNPVVGITDRAATKLILENADYDKIAAQYQPLDATSIAIDVLIGGAAGGAVGRARPKIAVTPDQHAAALVVNAAHVADDATLVTSPDPAARTAAIDAQEMAARQLENGEPVSVTGLDLDPAMIEAKRADAEAKLREMGAREPLEFEVVSTAERIDMPVIEGGPTGERFNFVARTPDGQEIGSVAFNKYTDGTAFPEHVEVLKEFRLQGVASAMYDAAKGMGLDVRISDKQSPDGKGFQDAWQRRQDAKQAAEAAPARHETGQAAEQADPVRQLIDMNPDRMIRMDDGTDVRAADLFDEVEAEIAQTTIDSKAYEAAATCFMRFGDA